MGRLAPPRKCFAVFSSVLGSAVLEELYSKVEAFKLDLSSDPTSPYMVLRTVDISISIVGRLNATNQEEMQGVLRIRSMNCFQTFRAQLIFLSLKFFKLIHSFLVVLVLSVQCRSVIKLLQSVLLDNGTEARFMVFFLKFFPLPAFTAGTKVTPKDIQGSNRDINYQFNSNLRLCQERIFTVIQYLRSNLPLKGCLLVG